LTAEQFESFRARDPNHAGYESLGAVINPPYPPLSPVLLNDLNGIWNTLRVCKLSLSLSLLVLISCRSVAEVGFLFVKGALVSGTYHSPKGPPLCHSLSCLSLSLSSLPGLYYGGYGPSNSVRLLRDFFSGPVTGLSGAKKYVFVDVHTGLGPSGIDTMMIHDEEKDCKTRTEKYFPTGGLRAPCRHLPSPLAEFSQSDPPKPIGGIKPWLSGRSSLNFPVASLGQMTRRGWRRATNTLLGLRPTTSGLSPPSSSPHLTPATKWLPTLTPLLAFVSLRSVTASDPALPHHLDHRRSSEPSPLCTWQRGWSMRTKPSISAPKSESTLSLPLTPPPGTSSSMGSDSSVSF
jgi:hypothetical protein